ncbi:MAG TPA: histidine kinase [Blastocatellia bacterium]|nr:histidine kinase [Blastocatellia bacterium]
MHLDNRLIGATRIILALSVIMIGGAGWDPDQSDPRFIILIFYIVYSFILYTISLRYDRSQKGIPVWASWVDIAWFTALLLLSGGRNGFLFLGYLFAIIVVSFSRGFRAGFLITVVSVLAIISLSIGLDYLGRDYESGSILMRSLYIFVLGYLIARWGGIGITLSGRLMLLQEISNPMLSRMGIDNLIGSSLNRLRKFCGADSGLVLIVNPRTTEYHLYRTEGESPISHVGAEKLPKELLELMLTPLPAQSGVFGKPLTRWWRLKPSFQAYDVVKRKRTGDEWKESGILATMLEARSFITVPLRSRNNLIGRLYLTSKKKRAFNIHETGFLVQYTENLMQIIENVWLIDRLAVEGAEEERQRLARDIHDSIIQPFLGLQMGLAGLHSRLAVETARVGALDTQLAEVINSAAGDTDRLIEMADGGIADLRSYVRQLRVSDGAEGNVLSAVRRFTSKFTRATDILVQLKADPEIDLPDEIASEIFQMIVEGLSNIRKHTRSMRAYIGLERSGDRLVLRIENDDLEAKSTMRFRPQSIAERAEALGGRTFIEVYEGFGTSVVVEIPL